MCPVITASGSALSINARSAAEPTCIPFSITSHFVSLGGLCIIAIKLCHFSPLSSAAKSSESSSSVRSNGVVPVNLEPPPEPHTASESKNATVFCTLMSRLSSSAIKSGSSQLPSTAKTWSCFLHKSSSAGLPVSVLPNCAKSPAKSTASALSNSGVNRSRFSRLP